MSALTAIAAAMVSTLLAAVRLIAFCATGSLFLRRERPAAIHVPLAILTGAAVTAAMYAVLTRAALLSFASGVDASLVVISLALRGRLALRNFGTLWRHLRLALGSSRPRWGLASLIAALYWLPAAVPPRDTDSLRYHLAHIRQIDTDGAWVSMPIAHYAFPFAWQIDFLPFVRWGLPEVAQLLSVGLAFVVAASILSLVDQPEKDRTPLPLLVLAAFVLQPLMLLTATNASPDQFTMVAVLAACALFLAGDLSSADDLRALGFASWVAVGSRYQGVAIGIAVTLVVVALVIRRRSPVRTLWPFAIGATAAALLAAPWYVANLSTFGNPVWPLHTPVQSSLYADRVASAFAHAWHGPSSIGFRLQALWMLVTDPLAFPLPVAVLGVAVPALRTRNAFWTLGAFVVAHLVLWELAQPLLFPRFIVYLAPIAMAGAAWWSTSLRPASRVRERMIQVVLLAAIAVFGTYDMASSITPLSYLATGNRAALLRGTWYSTVYDWIGANTPPDARLLVVVGSGESYYLDRSYRRADPATSAVADWPSITDAPALVAWLSRERFDYVVYEDVDWSDAPAGAHVRQLMAQARSGGALVPVATFNLQLTRSRFRRRTTASTVYVLRVPSTAPNARRREPASPPSSGVACCTPAARWAASSPHRPEAHAARATPAPDPRKPGRRASPRASRSSSPGRS